MNKNIFFFAILLIAMMSNSNAQNIWTQKSDFGGTARGEAVGFSIGDKGYIGTGNDGIEIKKDFWEYDPASDVWTQKADLAGPERRNAVGFVVDGLGYIGTGQNAFDTLYDFWQYDPVTNSWTQKANLTGGARFWAVGFSIGHKGYIGTGYNNANKLKKDFWEYDPASDTWTKKANLGGEARQEAVGFSIGNKGYIGTGGVFSGQGITNDFWQYDPATNQWTKKADLGTKLASAAAFVIGSKGYIVTGSDTNDIYTNEFWEYDTLNDSWTEKASFAGTARVDAVAFTIAGKGYIGTGDDGPYKKDFWQYAPGCATPTGLAATNITNSKATVSWIEEAGSVKYNVRYKVAGINPWTSVYSSSTSKTINGLSANTTYAWQVKTVCGIVPSISSGWSVKQNFTTSLKLSEDEGINEPTVYPNPFTSSTTISFSLKENSHATILIFDLAGRKIKTLLDEDLDAGDHHIECSGKELSRGIYFLSIKINDVSFTRKTIIE